MAVGRKAGQADGGVFCGRGTGFQGQEAGSVPSGARGDSAQDGGIGWAWKI